LKLPGAGSIPSLFFSMDLRPYQNETLEAIQRDLKQLKKILVVSATGSGKTIIASEVMRRFPGNCLFLADAKQLVNQNADKYLKHSEDLFVGVEMGKQRAMIGDRVVVATSQSLARRLKRWPRNYFQLIFVDEAHRNTLGGYPKKIFEHFEDAKIIGMTATPWRSDKQQLGDFYENISIEVTLQRLIREGYLSRIIIKSVALNVCLDDVRTRAGDYAVDDLDERIEPHLEEAALLLKEHAPGRKTVAFLPLVKTSQEFVKACRSVGLKAIHVDGTERDGVERFEAGEFDVISNASLLTTGWDCPIVDCVFSLRPTKSLSLYSQMVGRGTRIHPEKENLLLLDPLFISDEQNLIKPARLIASSEFEARLIQEKLMLKTEEGTDLLEAEKEASSDDNLRRALAKKSGKKAKTVDAMDFFLSIGVSESWAENDSTPWERQPMTTGQRKALQKAGFDPDEIRTRGKASRLFDVIRARNDANLATPKQLKWLKKYGYAGAEQATMNEAKRFLGQKWGWFDKKGKR